MNYYPWNKLLRHANQKYYINWDHCYKTYITCRFTFDLLSATAVSAEWALSIITEKQSQTTQGTSSVFRRWKFVCEQRCSWWWSGRKITDWPLAQLAHLERTALSSTDDSGWMWKYWTMREETANVLLLSRPTNTGAAISVAVIVVWRRWQYRETFIESVARDRLTGLTSPLWNSPLESTGAGTDRW